MPIRQDRAVDGFRLAYERTGLDGAGHFSPLEAPALFAAAITAAIGVAG